MVEIRELLAPKGSKCRTGNFRTGMIGVTIHETDNESKGAGALNHAKYLQDGGQYSAVSWHYAVDDKLTTRSIPENEHAWHAGDGGSGRGNKQTIAIEICVNPESNYETAKKNAAELAADILYRHGFKSTSGCLFQHHDFMNKNCPRKIRNEGKWGDFVADTEKFLKEKTGGTPTPPSPVSVENYTLVAALPGYLTAADAMAGTNSKTTLSAGTYKVFKKADGAMNLTQNNDAGSWINPAKNVKAASPSGNFKVGDTVNLHGYVYEDSFGNGQSHVQYNRVGKITISADLSRKCPYHFENLGWVIPASIGASAPAPYSGFSVGERVKIKSSASKYARSSVSIPGEYRNKSYSIQQVDKNDVLIRELYSWVFKTDIEKA